MFSQFQAAGYRIQRGLAHAGRPVWPSLNLQAGESRWCPWRWRIPCTATPASPYAPVDPPPSPLLFSKGLGRTTAMWPVTPARSLRPALCSVPIAHLHPRPAPAPSFARPSPHSIRSARAKRPSFPSWSAFTTSLPIGTEAREGPESQAHRRAGLDWGSGTFSRRAGVGVSVCVGGGGGGRSIWPPKIRAGVGVLLTWTINCSP